MIDMPFIQTTQTSTAGVVKVAMTDYSSLSNVGDSPSIANKFARTVSVGGQTSVTNRVGW